MGQGWGGRLGALHHARIMLTKCLPCRVEGNPCRDWMALVSRPSLLSIVPTPGDMWVPASRFLGMVEGGGGGGGGEGEQESMH